ncbi:MAG: hypothetical protein II163_03395, partial [Ruminococcus sp.]|nr:hypothetical protein [Ruminococcus sp.]
GPYTHIEPHPLPLPTKPVKLDFKPVIYIDGKKVDGGCAPVPKQDDETNPARMAELLDEIAKNLGIMMYSTVGDYGTRVEDAYTNAKLMQTAKVIVGIQKYLTFVSTFVGTMLGKLGGHLTEKSYLGSDSEKPETLVDKFFSGTMLLGGIFYATEEYAAKTKPFLNSIKVGIAKKGQTEGNLRLLRNLGSLKPVKTVDAELSASLSALDSKLSEFTAKVTSGLTIFETLIKQATVKVEELAKTEATLEAILKNWSDNRADITKLNGDIFSMITGLYLKLAAKELTDLDYYSYYETLAKKVTSADTIMGKIIESIVDLDFTVVTIRGHIALNHYLRGQYGQDFDKYVKDHKLDVEWNTIKEAYSNEDLNDHFLAKIFPTPAEKIKTAKDIWDTKEKIRSIRTKTEKLGIELGKAADKGDAAIIAVLEKEGLELASEFEALKPFAELISNTLKLVQLANEKDEMTKAMGSFGDATLKLNYHTYEAVRNDSSTGALSKDSPLVKELMDLIEEAIVKSNEKAPGAFKPFTSDDRTAVAAYLVQYLNVQREKYERSENTDSSWMKAHVSGVMAALFEQLYVDAVLEQATPKKFLEFMRNSDKVDPSSPLDSYLDSTLGKKIFRDVRQDAISRLMEAQLLVRHYSDRIAKNSSYPVKQIVGYLEELSQKLQAAANVDQISTRRYKDLDIWQLMAVSKTELRISTSYRLSFRDYQKALLNTDVINNENMSVVLDYYTAALYDLIVRSALMVVTMSPNAISASVGASASAMWDSLADQVFTKLDDAWKSRTMLTAMSLAELSLVMGSTVMKEAGIANDIYNLLFALDNAVIFDPPLDTELVTYSIKDVVIPDGKSTAKGEVLVTFRNDGDKTVAISPNVSIYTAFGKVASAEFNSNSILIGAGETAEFIGTFTVSRSVLLDSTGYSAVLSYAASEPDTVSIAAEQGPFVIHFYAGSERQISAMRSKVSAGTLVSGWVTGQDTLSGSITVKQGENLRVFAAAPVNGKLAVEIISPTGEKVAAESFINEGDYAIIRNCEAGTYTVNVTTPVGYDNRITVEGVVSSFDKAITAVHTEDYTVINGNDLSEDGKNYGMINFSVSESAGISAGTVSATLDFEDENLTASIVGLEEMTLKAGGAFNGGFIIKADPDTPAGAYRGTLRVAFDANTCDPVFLSFASFGDDAEHWSIVGDKVVYTAQVTVTVDLTAPDAPDFTVEEGETAGTFKVTGTAPGAAYVILAYENDFEEENDEGETETYTVRSIAAVFDTDADGSFSMIIAKFDRDARLIAIAVNAAGGLSASATESVEGYSEPAVTNDKPADPFTSVKVQQVDGKRDVTVSISGAQITGLTMTGDIYYRVVDTQPTTVYLSGEEFDPTGWTIVGTASAFTVKNLTDGRYIEVVQVAKENVYSADENGELTVSGEKLAVVRQGGEAIELEEVQGYTVSGALIPDDVKAHTEGAILVLTDASDSSVTYTAAVTLTDGRATYTFSDVISGTYILS